MATMCRGLIDGVTADCVGMISGLSFLNAHSVETCLTYHLLITASPYGLLAK
ncbi:phosphoribosylaminoimidazole synthetase [Yersinia sp. 1652 StPb PI]|uniref:phosphoribosylaminoimidazole synthetase n=1 Tax=unclassified Yersinia (in: enterobacteria) TaxID=2653513 RepID=UPI00355C8AAD